LPVRSSPGATLRYGKMLFSSSCYRSNSVWSRTDARHYTAR